MTDIVLKEGLSFELKKKVEYKDTAAAYGSGLLDVFATPAMIALMENCALQSVADKLPKNHSTVGTSVNIKHIKATKLNDEVVCKSKLIKTEGRKLTFELEVFDSEGKIGFGEHKRYIVDNSKFML